MATIIRRSVIAEMSTTVASCSRYSTCRCCAGLRSDGISKQAIRTHRIRESVLAGPRTRDALSRDIRSLSSRIGTTNQILPSASNPNTASAVSPHLPLPPPLPYSSSSLPFLRHLSILQDSLFSSSHEVSWDVWMGLHASLRGQVGVEVLGRLLDRQLEQDGSVVGLEGGNAWNKCVSIFETAEADGLLLRKEPLERLFVIGTRHLCKGTDTTSIQTSDMLLRVWEHLLRSAKGGNAKVLQAISAETRIAWLTLQRYLQRRSIPSYITGTEQRDVINAVEAIQSLAEHGALADISTSSVVSKIILNDYLRSDRLASPSVSSQTASPRTSTPEQDTAVSGSTHGEEWMAKFRLIECLRERGAEVAPEVRERIERRCGVNSKEGGTDRKPAGNMAGVNARRFRLATTVLDAQPATEEHARSPLRPLLRRSPNTESTDSQSGHIRSLSTLLSSPFDPARYLTGLREASEFVSGMTRGGEAVSIGSTVNKEHAEKLDNGDDLAEALLAMMLEVHSRIVRGGTDLNASAASPEARQASLIMARVVERHAGTLLAFGRQGWSRLVLDCLVAERSGPDNGRDTQRSKHDKPMPASPAMGIYQAVRNGGLRWTQAEEDLALWDTVMKACFPSDAATAHGLADSLLNDAIADGVHLGTDRTLTFLADAARRSADEEGRIFFERYLAVYKGESSWEPGVVIPEELLGLILIETKLSALSGQLSLFAAIKSCFYAVLPSSSPSSPSPMFTSAASSSSLALTYSSALSLLRVEADRSAQSGNFTSRWSDLAYELLVDSVKEDVVLSIEDWNSVMGLCLFGMAWEAYLVRGLAFRFAHKGTPAPPAADTGFPAQDSRTKARILYHLLLSSSSPSSAVDSFSPDDVQSDRQKEGSRLTDPTGSGDQVGLVHPTPNGQTISLFLEDYRRHDRRGSLRRMWSAIGGGRMPKPKMVILPPPMAAKKSSIGTPGIAGIQYGTEIDRTEAKSSPQATSSPNDQSPDDSVSLHPEVARRVRAAIFAWNMETKNERRLAGQRRAAMVASGSSRPSVPMESEHRGLIKPAKLASRQMHTSTASRNEAKGRKSLALWFLMGLGFLPFAKADTENLNFRLDVSRIAHEDYTRDLSGDVIERGCSWQDPTEIGVNHLMVTTSPEAKAMDLCTVIATGDGDVARGYLDGWRPGRWPNFGMYTARVSWPATHPAAFSIKLEHSPPPYHTPFFRIAMNHTGVPVPSDSALRLPSRLATISSSTEVISVPFHLLVEPLLFGFLPATALGTVFAVIVMGVLGWGLSRWVIRVVEGLGDGVGELEREKVN